MHPELKLTNQKKIYWPKEKYTKGDLIEYYRKIAPVILPYLKNRAESLNRHPNGIKGASFFQKNFPNKLPSFVGTFKHYSESNDAMIRWVVCNNKETLLYMANLGCIEINPWNSTVKTPDNPTWMVIDLDPDDNDFSQVIEAAQVTHKILDKIKVPNYCKTSGKTGMHIFVPIGNKYTYEQVRRFAEVVANLVHRELPDFTSVVRMPKKRKGKIYIDFLQNRIGQTLAAPYSVRPSPGATVSTPLLWKEVKKGLHPSDFTMKNIFSRLDKTGDIWKGVLGKGSSLEKSLPALQKLF